MPGTSLVGKLPKYFQSVEEVDALIGRLISTLAEIDLLKSTIIFMTADHGGKGTSHGQSTMEELEIPWIISGPGVPPGHEIRSAVNTYDLAPTNCVDLRAEGARLLDWEASPGGVCEMTISCELVISHSDFFRH